MTPIEPGERVRCPSCAGPRFRAWAPGIIACTECYAWSTLRADTVEKTWRLQCFRRCRRGLIYLTSATTTRPGTFQCVECHAEAPLPFDARAIRAFIGPRVLWRVNGRYMRKRRTVEPVFLDPDDL